jgi:hypothetical protein
MSAVTEWAGFRGSRATTGLHLQAGVRGACGANSGRQSPREVRPKSQCDFNNIWVPSYIQTGAPRSPTAHEQTNGICGERLLVAARRVPAVLRFGRKHHIAAVSDERNAGRPWIKQPDADDSPACTSTQSEHRRKRNKLAAWANPHSSAGRRSNENETEHRGRLSKLQDSRGNHHLRCPILMACSP